MRQLQKLVFYKDVVRTKAAFAFVLAKLTAEQALFKLTVPTIPHPVFIRLATTDASVFCQVLVERHYDFRLANEPRPGSEESFNNVAKEFQTRAVRGEIQLASRLPIKIQLSSIWISEVSR